MANDMVAIIAMIFMAIAGAHLILHNRIVVINLTSRKSIFATKVLAATQDEGQAVKPSIVSRIMIYLIGVVFIAISVLGMAKKVIQHLS